MDKIVLRNMEFWGRIGCLPEEKTNDARYLVTVTLYVDEIKGAESDRLEDTIDYSKVFDIAKDVIESEPMNLIEYAAGRIAREVKARYEDIARVKVTISKPDAPIDGVFETMEVTIER